MSKNVTRSVPEYKRKKFEFIYSRPEERTIQEKLRNWCANTMKWSKYVIFDTQKGVVIKEGRYESK